MDRETKEKLKELIPFLQSNLGAKAIILSGSRSVSDYDQASDLDCFIFTKKKVKIFQGIVAREDLDVVAFPMITKYSWESFGLKLRFSDIVLDTKNSMAWKITQ